MNELKQAIELLYGSFAGYSRPMHIEACPCGCTAPNATDVLIAAPLRRLRFEDLADYSFSAMTTQGNKDDFRYLLPRLFQGIVEESYSYNCEILFGKLAHAKWLEWPEHEVIAVRNYLGCLWREGLAAFPVEKQLPAFYEIETLLASISVTEDNLKSYLCTWSEAKAIAADEHLIQFVTMFGNQFAGGKTLREAFWQTPQVQADDLRTWLLQPETLQRIADNTCLLRNDGFEHLFQPALDILRAEASS